MTCHQSLSQMSASKTNDTSALLLKISSLQAELSQLQRRYDALFASKERAASRYKADYKKWRAFKLWLSKSSNCDKEIHSMLKDTSCGADRTPSAINKRRKFDGMGPPLTAFDHAEEQMSNKLALTRTYIQVFTRLQSISTDSGSAPDVPTPSKQHMVSPIAHALRDQTISTKVETQPAAPSKLLRPVQEQSVGKGILDEELPAGAFPSIPMLDQPLSTLSQARPCSTVPTRVKTCTRDVGDMPKPGRFFQYYMCSTHLTNIVMRSLSIRASSYAKNVITVWTSSMMMWSRIVRSEKRCSLTTVNVVVMYVFHLF